MHSFGRPEAAAAAVRPALCPAPIDKGSAPGGSRAVARRRKPAVTRAVYQRSGPAPPQSPCEEGLSAILRAVILEEAKRIGPEALGGLMGTSISIVPLRVSVVVPG